MEFEAKDLNIFRVLIYIHSIIPGKSHRLVLLEIAFERSTGKLFLTLEPASVQTTVSPPSSYVILYKLLTHSVPVSSSLKRGE